MKLPRFRLKKIRKNPDSGKKPDSKIFRIFSKMNFLRYFVIIKCFSFFNITIFKAAMAYEKSKNLHENGLRARAQ